MEEKYFTIATLTHDGDMRSEYFVNTVGTFLENTNYNGKIHWHIYHNGKYDSPIVHKLNELIGEFGSKVQFSIRVGGSNMGIGYGINKINEWAQDYKYTLFLEGDWITLPEDFTNQDKDWLIRSLDLMDKENLDQIQLRRYLSDEDDRQFGLGYWTNEQNIEKIENGYVFLKEREYSNSPSIYRNTSFFEVGIFPMEEFIDENGRPTELKHSKNWRKSESIAKPLGKKLKSSWLKGGIMAHCSQFNYENWDHVLNNMGGCDYDDGSLTHCKYGFMFPKEEFCKHCHKEKNFTDLEEHNQRFKSSLNNNML